MANTPGLAEPVSHDSHYAGPHGRLQQAVQHPQAAVQVDVVDVEPLRHGAEDKLLQATEGSEQGSHNRPLTRSTGCELTTAAEPHRPKQRT